MPVLQPAEPWRKTGRYEIDEIFKLKDRRGAEHGARDDPRGGPHVAHRARGALVPRPAEAALPLPDEGARRAAPARRPPADARVHHEGRLLLRPRPGGARRVVPAPHRGLRPHLRPHRARVVPGGERRRDDGRLRRARVHGALRRRRERRGAVGLRLRRERGDRERRRAAGRRAARRVGRAAGGRDARARPRSRRSASCWGCRPGRSSRRSRWSWRSAGRCSSSSAATTGSTRSSFRTRSAPRSGPPRRRRCATPSAPSRASSARSARRCRCWRTRRCAASPGWWRAPTGPTCT